MILKHIHIEGIGPHKDTALSFTGPSPLALCALSGTGKTSLLEAILICLFGKGAWWTDPYDSMTQGGTGQGKITLDFEHGGKAYRAVRIIKCPGKTKSQVATLYTLYTPTLVSLGYSTPALAGPKVTDFETAITRLIGSRDLFLSTQFLAQNLLGDLIGKPGTPDLIALRRKTFQAIINDASLDAIEIKAKDAAARAATKSETLAAQAGMYQAADMDAMRMALADAEAKIPATDQAIANINAAIRRSGQREADAKAEIARHMDTVNKFSGLQQRAGEIANDIAAKRQKQNRLKLQAQDADKHRHDAETLTTLTAERNALEKQREFFDEWSAWLGTAETIANDIAADRRIMNAIAVVVPTPEQEELAAKMPDLLKRGIEAKDKNDTILNANERLQFIAKERAQKVAQITRDIEMSEQRLARRPTTPGGPVCDSCPLVAEYAGIPERIATLREHLQTIEAQPVTPEAPLIDLLALREQYHAAKEAHGIVTAYAIAQTKRGEIADKIASLQADAAAHERIKPERADNPTLAISAINMRMQPLAGASDRLTAALASGVEAAAIDAEIGALEGQLAMVQHQAALIEPLAQDAQRHAEECTKTITMETAIRTDSETHMASANAERDKAIHTIAKLKADIEQAEKDAQRRLDMLAQADAERQRADDFVTLRQVFGARGIRQILIDQAAPQLETIADELFQQATGGRQRLRIATQRLLGDGTMAEDFSIRILDSRGERDAPAGYSGGELQVVRILFRIAVILWVSQLRGEPLEMLIADETFDSCDAEQTDALIGVLDGLKERIPQVIVVTHNPEVAARMPARVTLEKKAAGVEVATS